LNFQTRPMCGSGNSVLVLGGDRPILRLADDHVPPRALDGGPQAVGKRF
jgi:hypothetical protein